MERAAYHEAGHIVMAREMGIRVDAIRISQDLSVRHASQFARLGELYDLERPDDRGLRRAVHKYIRFLLAGPAAVLLRLERHHAVAEDSPHRTRFRRLWLGRTVARSDADVDYAYSLIQAWVCTGRENDLEQKFQEFWKLAIASYEYPALWRRVERIAARLMKDELTH